VWTYSDVSFRHWRLLSPWAYVFTLVPAVQQYSGLRTDRPTIQNANTSDGVKMCSYGFAIFAEILNE